MTVPIGSIVYLSSCIIRAKILAAETMPDTPNMYGAELEVMDDKGAIDTSNLVGKTGPDGQTQFALRQQETPGYSVGELPDNLTDSQEDIGKYYVISTRDSEGTITEQWAYVWNGLDTGYVKTYMGSEGPPGPVPDIRTSVELIDPELDAFVDTGGTALAPGWNFNLNLKRGIPGIPRPLYQFPDYDGDPEPAVGNVLMCSELFNDQGDRIFKPANLLALQPRLYSIPTSSFSDVNVLWGRKGIKKTWQPGSGTLAEQLAGGWVDPQEVEADEVVNIATVSIPPQPFDWTPIVWGHIGGTNNGLQQLLFAGDIFMKIGCQVSLGTNRTLISRGFSDGSSEINVTPHYSTSKRPTLALSPINKYALIPANHTSASVGGSLNDSTLHIDIVNDGQQGLYHFQAQNAQMFVMVMPIDAYKTYSRSTRRLQ